MRDAMHNAESGEMVVLGGSGQIALIGVAPNGWSSGTVALDEVRVLNLGPGEALVHNIGFRTESGAGNHCERAWRVAQGAERTVMSRDLHRMWSMHLAEHDPGAADVFGQPSGRQVELVVRAYAASGRLEVTWPCRLEEREERLYFVGEPA